jgi:hypothetical protein
MSDKAVGVHCQRMGLLSQLHPGIVLRGMSSTFDCIIEVFQLCSDYRSVSVEMSAVGAGVLHARHGDASPPFESL